MIPSFLKQKSAFYFPKADWIRLVEAFAGLDVPDSVKNPAQLLLWMVENREKLNSTTEVDALRKQVEHLQAENEKYDADTHIMGHRLSDAECKVEQLQSDYTKLKKEYEKALSTIRELEQKNKKPEPGTPTPSGFHWNPFGF